MKTPHIPEIPSVLFEMIRSFVALAHSLNLSAAVQQLGSTRQTVRRHISTLEEHMGVALFELEDRRYRLTEAGHNALAEAETLLVRGEVWLNGESGHVNGLRLIATEPEPGIPYFLQQHSLGHLWHKGSPLLQSGFDAWAAARGQIEHEKFATIRPYIMLFRQRDDEWICVEVGAESSYATWYGWQWERSSVGRGVEELPGGPGFAILISEFFQEITATSGVRFDHIHTAMRRGEEGILTPISYQRLLMGCRFPDGSFAIASLIDRSHDIEITGLPPGMAETMPEELLMDVTPPSVE